MVGEFDDGFLAHAVDEQVGTSIAEDALLQAVLPIVVMCQSSQGGFDAAEHDRNIGIQLLENPGIDDGGIFRTHVVTTVRTVGVLGTQAAVSCVFIHHRVHASWRNAKEQTRPAQFLEVAEVTMPVWLGDDGYFIASRLQRTTYDGRSERGVVDIGITREKNHIDLRPSAEVEFFFRCRQEICQSVFHQLKGVPWKERVVMPRLPLA